MGADTEDVDQSTVATTQSATSTNDKQLKKEEADDGAENSDQDAAEEQDDDTVETADGKLSNDYYRTFKAITEELLNFKIKTKSDEEHYPSTLFRRLPNRRLLPDYYEIIKNPSAISTLRGKIQRKSYSGVPEFVRDFALVVHNAQVYNRPNSQPVRDVLKLNEIFKTELNKMVEEGLATKEEIEYPDLGEIPISTPEADPVTEEDEAEGEDEEEEDEDADVDADDSDDDKRRKRGRRGRPSLVRKGEDDEDDDKAADAEQKRRGRPPKVATPTEHRIDRILKSLRKPRAKDGTQMLLPFERLPDKTEVPEYYQVITNPIAYDVLKRKAKRKKYASVDEFMKEVKLMFNNAMHFNEEGSDIYNWAQELLAEAIRVEAEERVRPDSEYLQAAEGRIPLTHIDYKNDTWKVGDWVHIQNPNDITKPIVAQIYRTWKTANDEEWINACWYYRPEQTVHQFEKHFFPNEVVKTGQYRDHKIEEVQDKCFVMFYTRYSRGRPRGLPEKTEVYVCEARYNENQHKFNKIKTWASCLPDEVRDKDYQMDLFEAPRKIKKIPSPLLHLLKDGAKETDEIPQPEWKHSNAPPVVGGIHKQRRNPQQSPPPEPTPPPQPAPTPVPITRTPSINHQNAIAPTQPNMERRSSSNLNGQMSQPRTPATVPHPTVSAPNQYTGSRTQTYASATHPFAPGSSNVTQQQAQPLPYPNQQIQPTTNIGNHQATYNPAAVAQSHARPVPNVAHSAQYNPYQAVPNITHRIAETYVLPEVANESIPLEIRQQFPRDEQGRVLFFTQPPVDMKHGPTRTAIGEGSQPLQHSQEYLERQALRKRKLEDIQNKQVKSRKMGEETVTNAQMEVSDRLDTSSTRQAFAAMADEVKQGMIDDYKIREGDDWANVMSADLERGKVRLADERKKDEADAADRKAFNNSHLGRDRARAGQYPLNAQGYIMGWRKDFFTGTYLDDFDPRLP